ncbi:cytochrome c oxidase subunit Va [Capsaspora owczarzaki ATCC 30864]|uniref:Cytochrome c oxidase subunit Va n=1 Tax=Capsaspora owczarzaki (strain ATCC 30864) TaxID=595528 RepID=A0A0D2WXC7_CAPO3|nr:cytochrome c oxidase subunit Va [Capsaspora owczarzaki ATCC 30864]KJE97408.1 cytochrome c oxidase subunit Va [Capsaspora owczarzaki ATCC 30864]|eukprot:XP_004343135.1 cytochrome c oxidase subunit Va [Capsaspora owczarzaki ATCC 30864]
MLRAVSSTLFRSAVASSRLATVPAQATQVAAVRAYSAGHHVETDAQFDARWLAYFQDPNLDLWELRNGLNTLLAHDVIPEPAIVAAALRQARRHNDFALAVRTLEAIRVKSNLDKSIYPWMMKELKPVIDELHISLPEELNIPKLSW